MLDATVTDGVFAIVFFFFMIGVVVNTPIFSFVSITRSEMELCFYFLSRREL